MPTTAIRIPDVVKPASKIQLTVSLVKPNGAMRFIIFTIPKPKITQPAMTSAKLMGIKIVIAPLKIKGYFLRLAPFDLDRPFHA